MRTVFKAFFILFLAQMSIGCVNESSANNTQKVFLRNELQKQARQMVENGLYSEAIAKYRQAIAPENINTEYEKALAVGSITDILKLQGKYEQALIEYSWFLRHDKPTSAALEEKREIEALIEFLKTDDKKVVYNVINDIKRTHADDLPPKNYHTHSNSYIVNILTLYDTLGDYDAGIKFVDEVLDYKLSRNKNVIRPNSANEAMGLSRKEDTLQDKKNRRSYEVLAEYLLIREAFLQDKTEGKKGSMKEGKPGRATLALIKSDYFPW